MNSLTHPHPSENFQVKKEAKILTEQKISKGNADEKLEKLK